MAYKRKRKQKRTKAKARKKIDKQQNRELAILKKEVSLLKTVKEPQLLEHNIAIRANNATTAPIQIRMTADASFAQNTSEMTLAQGEDYREGNQISIGNIRCYLTLYDINNNFKWRVIVCQYPERNDITNRDSAASFYDADDELGDMLKYYSASDVSIDRESATTNIISPMKLIKLRKNKCHVLYDKVIVGKYRELKIAGVGNETRTIKFTIKPKMRKLTFESHNHRSPHRGDIVCYIFNDYGFYGTWSSTHTNTQKYKSLSMKYCYNVYDE